jgi:hypothetical protein
MWLKQKYRERKGVKRTMYRGRTGPKCCNAGCGSTYKKTKKAVSKR